MLDMVNMNYKCFCGASEKLSNSDKNQNKIFIYHFDSIFYI